MFGDPVDFGQTLCPHFLYERRQRLLIQPSSGLRQGDDGRQATWWDGKAEIAEDDPAP